MEFRFAPFLISVVVGVVLAATVLMPIVSDATDTDRTFTNEGYYSMDKLDTTASLVIAWDATAPTQITVGDKTVDMSFVVADLGYTIVGSEEFAIRYSMTGGGDALIQGFGSEYFNQGNGTEITITINGGTVAAHTNRSDIEGGITITYTYSDSVYVINPYDTGEYSYVMKKTGTNAYVNGDSSVYFIGATYVESTKVVATYGEGTIDDGITLETIGLRNVTNVSYSDPVATYAAVNGYNDLYALDKYDFIITYDGNTYDATYSYFIVPATVTAEKSQHMSAAEISLISIIPILVLAGVVVGIAAVIGRRAELF